MNTIKLDIEHKTNYKLLKIKTLKNISTNDINTLFIMLENFINNCKVSNLKFGWIFDLKDLNEVNIVAINCLTNFCKNNYDSIITSLISTAIITNDNIFKKFFKLFTKFYDPVKPVKSCLDYNDSITFIDDCFNKKYNNDEIIY